MHQAPLVPKRPRNTLSPMRRHFRFSYSLSCLAMICSRCLCFSLNGPCQEENFAGYIGIPPLPKRWVQHVLRQGKEKVPLIAALVWYYGSPMKRASSRNDVRGLGSARPVFRSVWIGLMLDVRLIYFWYRRHCRKRLAKVYMISGREHRRADGHGAGIRKKRTDGNTRKNRRAMKIPRPTRRFEITFNT